MTIQRAVILLCQMYLPCFDEEEQEALTMAINALQEKEKCGFPPHVTGSTQSRSFKTPNQM